MSFSDDAKELEEENEKLNGEIEDKDNEIIRLKKIIDAINDLASY